MRPHNDFSHNSWLGWIPVVLISAGILAMAGWASAQEEQKEAVSSVTFEAFEIIVNRNIFDPNRKSDRKKPTPEELSASADTKNGATSEEESDNFKSDEVALVGTLIDGSTAVAFFTSETSDFKTVAQVGESVGDFKLAEIRTDCVRLEDHGKTIDLPVGSRMSSQKDGAWSIGMNPRPVPSPSGGPGPAPTTEGGSAKPAGETTPPSPEATPSGAASSGVDDVLKKLMERRRKALEK